MTVTSAPALRCSAWTRSQSVDPVGSAGWYRGFVLVEVPLPWPRDISEVPALRPLTTALDGQGLRVQALVPTDTDRPGRLVVHAPGDPDRTAGWFSGYRRTQADVGPDPAATVGELLRADPPSGGGDPVQDLLVCTHGRRDVCCGSQGTELVSDLSSSGRLPTGVGLRRTSHTGGHRFAPTFLLLPQGTMWAYADLEFVEQVLHRSVPFNEVAPRYRGCAGIGPAPVQALERAVLAEVGWDLLDRRRRGYATGEDGGTRFRLEADGGCWEATVRAGRRVPVPECMRPLSEARKTATEWGVSDLRAV